jgi:outer membrane protein TolC
MRMRKHLVLIVSALLALPAAAADPPTQGGSTATKTTGGWSRFSSTWRPLSVPAPNWSSGSRYADLLRAGQLYLSLRDAIDIAIENNLDVELQRYNILAAQKDLLRAQGGGVTRGLQYLINEAPLGIGGPASPLLTSLGAQSGLGSSIPTNPSELGVLNETQGNLSLLGQNTLSTGTALPNYDPSLSAALGYAHNSTQELDPSSYGTNNVVTTAMNANAGLQQGFSSGATAALAFDNSRNTINSNQSNYSPYVASSLSLSVTQPLLRGFGRGLNRRYIRIAANQEKIASLLFQQQLVSTVYGVSRLYIDLATLREDVTVKERNLELAEWLKREVDARVQEGVLPPIEQTRVNAGVLSAKQDLINSRALEEEQEAIFKSILFRQGLADAEVRNARLVPTDTLELPRGAEDLDVGKLIAQALAERPDLQQAGLQAENTRISLEGSRNALKPQLDLVAFAENTGLAGERSPLAINPDTAFLGGYGSALAQVFQRNYPIYGAGLQLNLPLHNRTAQADAARDEIASRQAEVRLEQFRNQARLEVQDAVIALRRAQASYEAAAEAARLQTESLEAEKARFEEGLGTAFSVGQFQSVLSQARLTELAARGSYAKAKAVLLRATGAILDAHGLSGDALQQAQALR